MSRIVIALGGNAIQKDKDQVSAEAQKKVIGQSIDPLLDLVEQGYEVIVTHGNGPQVGNLLLQQTAAESDTLPAMLLDTCGAMSQGMIGYWMQQALTVGLARRGINKVCATIITQTLVDAKDKAFQHPSKPIGPFYSEEEAKKIGHEKGYAFKEDSGRGWRRVVPSPRPQKILEQEIISELVGKGNLIICAGGGGVPVIRKDDGGLEGVEAVIDKDLVAARLAEFTDADTLLILTAVDEVMLNFHKPDQKVLKTVSADEMHKYITQGHFAPGSMLPKVEAALQFVESRPGRVSIITSLGKIVEALKGEAGTHLSMNTSKAPATR